MNRLWKGILLLVAFFVALAVAVTLQHVEPNQKLPTIVVHQFADTLVGTAYDLDSIRALIGRNKGLPVGFETAAAIAYSAFPQLKDVQIDLILTQDGAPMESTVSIWSLFGPRHAREYHILLNNAENSYFDPILLRSLPFDAQVGILAHELGHIVYYEELNVLQFGKWGLKYLQDDQFRAAHERSTDMMPVYYGLGSQIYQYAYYVRYDPSCKEFYAQGKDFMDTYYLTDEELLEAIQKP